MRSCCGSWSKQLAPYMDETLKCGVGGLTNSYFAVILQGMMLYVRRYAISAS